MVVQFIAAAAGVASIGMSLYGANQQRKAQQAQANIASAQAEVEKQQIGVQRKQLDVQERGANAQYESWVEQNKLEKQAEDVRKTAMTFDASRRSLEQVRLLQRARSMGLTTATSQGAGGGSVLNSAFGAAMGQVGYNATGLATQYGFGMNLFNINRESTLAKEALASKLHTLQSENFGYTREGFTLAETNADLKAQMVRAGGDAALGAGVSSVGNSIISALPSIGRLAGNFFGDSGSSSGINQGVAGGGYVGTGGVVYPGPGRYD